MMKGILLIENQTADIINLSTVFNTDYQVWMAAGTGEAWDILAEERQTIDCVVLCPNGEKDVYCKFLKEWGKHLQYANIPLVVYAKAVQAEYEKEMLKLGAWDFILESAGSDLLKLRVDNAIARSEASGRHMLRYRAEHDSITGLYNRKRFLSETSEMISQERERKFAFVRLDIASFRLINAGYGTTMGNRVLSFMGEKLEALMLPKDLKTYGRMDGDIFACCFSYESGEEVLDFIEAYRKELRGFDNEFDLSPSFGIYLVEDLQEESHILLDKANLAARQVKESRMGFYQFYHAQMSREIELEQRITKEMAGALAKGQFVIYFQPKYSLQTNMPAGTEALVRWNHPELGLIPPNSFIPVFEQNGFITRLDFYVWEQVCILLRKWMDEGKSPAPVSVNVSKVNLYNPHLVESICDLTEKYCIPHYLLQLELTEGTYAENPVTMKQVVRELQKKGFVVMMDDFGSGYSSLNMLKDIEVDILKIDMRFLAESDYPARGESILAFVVRMAKWLHIPVVAEGVERAEQVEFLQSIGCEFVQGYYFARPMPLEDYEKVAENKDALLSKKSSSLRPNRITGKLLVVDDQEINRIILEEIFKKQFNILHAKDGNQALEILAEHDNQVDIILLDLIMPGMSGMEFLEEKQKNSEITGIPVVIITADESAECQLNTLALGANDYIVKPFVEETVVRRVQNVLESNRRFRDILQEYNSVVRKSKMDPLTGIYNRGETEQLIQQLLKDNPQSNFAMIMIDIDNFKQINDTCGHVAGDSVLTYLAKNLAGFFRKEDIIGRFGGDEFAVFMMDVPSAEVVKRKCDTLCETIFDHYDMGTSMQAAISVGAALSGNGESDFEALYRNADAALYESKNKGKNQATVYSGKEEI